MTVWFFTAKNIILFNSDPWCIIRSDILWDSWIFFRLINSAQKIHKEAELNESLGDDEKAYILYMKYFNVVTLARKLPDYKKQKVVDNSGHHLCNMIPWKVLTWFSNVNPWFCSLYKLRKFSMAQMLITWSSW